MSVKAPLVDVNEPIRTDCPDCGQPVLAVIIPASPEHRREARLVVAEPFEWEARTRCYVCANNAARSGNPCAACHGTGYADARRFLTRRTTTRGQEASPCRACDGLGVVGAPKRDGCSRCGGAGYVGEARPEEAMLAIDVAWSDEGHVRVVGPNTRRKKGEALYRLHPCDQAAIVVPPEPRRKVAA